MITHEEHMNLSERQKQIVEESIRLIADKGMQKFTMKRVAEAIKVTEPAVYRHFENKQAILLAVLDYFDEIRCNLLDASHGESGFVRIERFVLGLIDLFAANPPLASLMFSEEFIPSDRSLSRRMLQVMHGHKDRLEQLILQAQTEGDLRTDLTPLQVFRLIMGPIRLVTTQWRLSGLGFDLRIEGSSTWSGLCRALRV
jgi:AcrR family transcriptional regulator